MIRMLCLRNGLIWGILAAVVVGGGGVSAEAAEPNAADRAIAFLSREVPQWPVENRCFSCHNNGDGARALYAAVRAGRDVDPQVLEATTAFLRRPGRWEHNGGEGKFSDKKLAAIQFSAALLDALRTDAALDRSPLKDAAAIVAGYQEDDGSWVIDAQGALGSPVTYGQFLATATALRVLKAAEDSRHRGAVEKAEAWLRTQRPTSVLDAAATILGLAGADDRAALEQRRRSIALLRDSQGESGGWGPYRPSPPEPFDTAIALLALAPHRDDPEIAAAINRGRSYFIQTQLPDGSWPETTRPARAVSYAQRLSTTAWATQALLATEEPK
ncbi:MAG: terpene cyclase/mutase family protein [Planctomycetes bacterium]|nr:terpene cyclase/mutase family protein [Planctomycetota bacterium]